MGGVEKEGEEEVVVERGDEGEKKTFFFFPTVHAVPTRRAGEDARKERAHAR